MGGQRGAQKEEDFSGWVWSLEVVPDKDMRVIHTAGKCRETEEFRTLCAMRDWKGKPRADCIGP